MELGPTKFALTDFDILNFGGFAGWGFEANHGRMWAFEVFAMKQVGQEGLVGWVGGGESNTWLCMEDVEVVGKT